MTAGTIAWRGEVELAVTGWHHPPTTLHAVGHAFFLQLIRSASPAAAQLLHDAGVRKPLALSPLRIEPVANGMARGRLIVSAWEPEIVRLIGDALAGSLTLVKEIRGCPALVTGFRPEPELPLNRLLVLDRVPASVAVRFASPTFFSLGRRYGRQQYGLVPVPELVAGSWLKTWLAAGGEAFEAEISPGWLAERVVIHEIPHLTTETVDGGKTALTGFRGEVRYAWTGPEPWGRTLLAALARFAGYCGTGAKTGYGFGVTVPLGLSAGPEPASRPLSPAVQGG